MIMKHAIRWALAPLALTAGCLGNEYNDLSAPVVVIVKPEANATISGRYTIEVQAADDTGLEVVTVLIDNVKLGELYYAPFDFTWPTTQVTDGVHVITAVAEDRVGNRSSVARSVTVNNEPN
jgi:hypothetical protein